MRREVSGGERTAEERRKTREGVPEHGKGVELKSRLDTRAFAAPTTNALNWWGTESPSLGSCKLGKESLTEVQQLRTRLSTTMFSLTLPVTTELFLKMATRLSTNSPTMGLAKKSGRLPPEAALAAAAAAASESKGDGGLLGELADDMTRNSENLVMARRNKLQSF